jgi:hypothetical protein
VGHAFVLEAAHHQVGGRAGGVGHSRTVANVPSPRGDARRNRRPSSRTGRRAVQVVAG